MVTDKQQKIIFELQRVASLLGSTTLSVGKFSKHSKFDTKTIRAKFGSWNKAIEAAGLTPISPTRKDGRGTSLSDDELLQEIFSLSVKLGKRPTQTEMIAFGRFGVTTYHKRWRTFAEAVKAAYAKYGVPDNVSLVALPEKKTPYGEPIDFRGLRHAPVNKQGVMYLFGMVSRELGFLIESLRIAYPDCEGKRCVDEKRQLWENVLIEFEFKSTTLRGGRGRNPERCDLVVCWIHDWEDCPLEVLELRSAIRDLPNQ